MNNVENKSCVCKGVRSCLVCEEEKGNLKPVSSVIDEDLTEYIFCDSCGLCWSSENPTDCMSSVFRLPGILLIHDFISEEEERKLVSEIDQISWVSSQSGRRKQEPAHFFKRYEEKTMIDLNKNRTYRTDFGPKVNFKKRKVKVKEFCGFPEFSAFIVKRFASVPSMSSFYPVELCNLEYCPERGSAIEPHVDDIWLWGERLITLNLLSSTILTLTPVDDPNPCSSHCENKSVLHEDLAHKFNFSDCKHTTSGFFMENNCKCCHLMPAVLKHSKKSMDFCIIGSCNELPKANLRNRTSPTTTNNHVINASGHKENGELDLVKHISCAGNEHLQLNWRSKSQKSVKISFPPRSLLVLYDCARYHWFHSIARKDITNRRLAMTFRELSSEFLPGGSQSEIGEVLLDVAKVHLKR